MRFLNWLYDRAVWLDIKVNIMIGGRKNETLSGRCWRLRDFQPYKTIRPILDWAFSIWGPNHCQRSYEKRMQP